eukprot:m.98668 g.98668  ORF g.98668 m.98668 type:complete len:261 (-) comp14015_c0_seq3:30-812(-)
MARRGSVGGKVNQAFMTFLELAKPANIPGLEELLQDYLDLFKRVDGNGSGSISVDELKGSRELAERLAKHKKTMEDLERMVLKVDMDGNCQLDPSEFFNLMLVLEGKIDTPIDGDEKPKDRSLGELHVSVILEPDGKSFLLRVKDFKLHLPESAKVDLRVTLMPSIKGLNTPMQQKLASARSSNTHEWDQVLAWTIPHTENLSVFTLSISVDKHSLLRRKFFSGMTLPLPSVAAPVDSWFRLLDLSSSSSSLRIDGPTRH